MTDLPEEALIAAERASTDAEWFIATLAHDPAKRLAARRELLTKALEAALPHLAQAGSAAPSDRDPASTTSATVERAAQWDHDTRSPIRAGIGFRSPTAGGNQ